MSVREPGYNFCVPFFSFERGNGLFFEYFTILLLKGVVDEFMVRQMDLLV